MKRIVYSVAIAGFINMFLISELAFKYSFYMPFIMALILGMSMQLFFYYLLGLKN